VPPAYFASPSNALTHARGIYVPDDERWPAHFRGIGIRIEDSVCVGDEHPIVLTPEAVKEVCLPATWIVIVIITNLY
jgi:intermediate cleaving peptidase 55